MKNELKPCPFCGSEIIDTYEDGIESYVQCRGCHVLMDNLGTLDENIEAWNRRVEK